MKYFVAEVQHDETGDILCSKKVSRVHLSVGDKERENMDISRPI